MIMNKKGFTLVELLSVMVILGIISMIAVPNVVKIMADNKKEKVINDGLSMIALAKQKIAGDYDLREQVTVTGYNYTLDFIDKTKDIVNDPNGLAYDRTNSYVKVYKTGGVITYCVYLKSNNWILNNNNNCVLESLLLGDNTKNYVKEN